VLGVLVLAASTVCRAQQTPAAAPASPVEPDAIAALKRMSEYLRTLKAMAIRADTTLDEVTDDGMKLQFGGTVTMLVQRPNRLRAEVDSDRRHRQIFYDGKSLTIYGERVGYYATVPAPATLRELADNAEEKYGLRLPLADLFYWGADDSWKTAVKEAAIIGPGRIGNAMCDHVAVRQEGVDWQIWIEQGKTPLPRKLVITTTSESAQPQYTSVLQWNLAPKIDAASFRFAPPKNAHKIPLKSADAAAAGK
jgi:hypothetical protein